MGVAACSDAAPALCRVAGLLVRIALGQLLFLRQLRRRAFQPNLVRQLLRYYGVVRLPGIVHRILIPLGFHTRTRPDATSAGPIRDLPFSA